MRKLFMTALAGICFALPAIAQTAPEQNPVIITTWHYTPPGYGDTTLKGVNIDTLMAYYMDKGIRPNPLIKNFRILAHYWGDDSYNVMFVYEVDKWENVNKSEEKTTQLIDASFKNTADKDLYWKRWGKLFNRHDDSIMADWLKPKM